MLGGRQCLLGSAGDLTRRARAGAPGPIRYGVAASIASASPSEPQAASLLAWSAPIRRLASARARTLPATQPALTGALPPGRPAPLAACRPAST